MRIATYNTWNSDAGMPIRFRQLVDAINGVQADILCLQEVENREKHLAIASLCRYSHACWQEKAGLSILTRYPMAKAADFAYGMSALVQAEGKTFLVVNVHLPWESALSREKAMVDIVQNIAETEADYTLLLGDFNGSAHSAVHRFLTNEQSLMGADAYYFDLAEAFAEISGTKAPATLNFRENPRWGVAEAKNTVEVNQRVDWMMLKNPYPAKLPQLNECSLFGTDISEETGLAASDHYGVAAELEF